MSKKPFIAYFMCAALSALFTQQAAAWGTGGGVTNPFKVIEGLTLFCDLSHPQSTATIEAIPCGEVCEDFVKGAIDNPFVFQGPMKCAEIPADPDEWTTPGTPSLDDAVDLPGCPDCKGLFNLTQEKMDAGLAYTGDEDGADGTWSFTVQQGPRDENLLWELRPVDGDAGAEAICTVLGPGVEDCVTYFGLEEKENANDYDEQPGFVMAGEVFNFSTVGGLPQNLNWFPCHSGSFDPSADIKCEVNLGGGNKKATRSEGEIEGVVIVEFEFTPELNMGNPSESSSVKLTICGSDEIQFQTDGAPVDTLSPISVNGSTGPASATILSFAVGLSSVGLCDDALPDLNLQVERIKVINAINARGNCSDGNVDIDIGGDLIAVGGEDPKFFEGMGTVAVHNCP